jgi:Zn-dependent peptidase ImmA (M78 family)
MDDAWSLSIKTIVSELDLTYSDSGVVELNCLARRLGAQDVRYHAQTLHGFTQWTDDGPYIQLKLARSDGRRRFTLAHEIGHLLLDPILDPQRVKDAISAIKPLRGLERLAEFSQYSGLTSPGIERLCDMFAAELLIPTFKVEEIREAGLTMSRLAAESARLRVSLSMLVSRLNSVRSDLCLLRAESNSLDKWIVNYKLGLPGDLDGHVALTRSSSERLNKLEPGLHDRVDLSLLSFDSVVSLTGSVKLSRRNVTILASRSALRRIKIDRNGATRPAQIAPKDCYVMQEDSLH